jgi:hypothetical protein
MLPHSGKKQNLLERSAEKAMRHVLMKKFDDAVVLDALYLVYSRLSSANHAQRLPNVDHMKTNSNAGHNALRQQQIVIARGARQLVIREEQFALT